MLDRTRLLFAAALLATGLGTNGCSADAASDSGSSSDSGSASESDSGSASGSDSATGSDAASGSDSGSASDSASDAPALPPPSGAPYVLYTDIASGPTTGGEQNLGAYLSIFGKNFGAGGLGTTLKVTIGGADVGAYVALGISRGRPDVEQLTVRVGALAGAAAGAALPIRVSVAGVASNTDRTFLINPGRFLYVDPLKGDDATAVVGDATKPWKTVQTTDLTKGAWGQVKPGDFLVLRGGTYVGVGREQYFMRFSTAGNGSGTAPTGQAGTGPITLMGYPGEDAFINGDAKTDPAGALSGLNGQNYPNAGKWVTIAGLRIEGGGYDGPISQEIYGDNWRVVNNELTALTGVTSGASPSRMAGITGNGKNAFWAGNHIHDIQGSQFEAHGIYIDGDGSYEIAYNVVHDCKSGKGIQTYANGGNGSDVINDVHIHHNVVHDVLQFGINVADGSSSGFRIYDNVVYHAKSGGLRFNTNTLEDCKVYNNTFYDTNSGKNTSYGAIMSDWNLAAGSLDVRNNLFWATPGTHATGGSVGIDGTVGTFSNNLWFGNDDTVTFDTNGVTADPKLVNPGVDFHLAAGSPAAAAGWAGASSLVVDDFDLAARPAGKYDIGAYQLTK